MDAMSSSVASISTINPQLQQPFLRRRFSLTKRSLKSIPVAKRFPEPSCLSNRGRLSFPFSVIFAQGLGTRTSSCFAKCFQNFDYLDECKPLHSQPPKQNLPPVIQTVLQLLKKNALSVAIALVALSAFSVKGNALASPPAVATVSATESKMRSSTKEGEAAEELKKKAKDLMSLSSLKSKEAKLIAEAQKAVDSYHAAEAELEKMPVEDARRVVKEAHMKHADEQFRSVWSSLIRLEAEMLSIETEALRLGLEHEASIPSTAQEEEQNVSAFPQQSGDIQNLKDLATARMQRELEYKAKKGWERYILPIAVREQNPEVFIEESKSSFSDQLRKEDQYSKEMQKKLDDIIREQFKNHGEEKIVHVKRSAYEIFEGLAPLEAKWLFGNKEVLVPGAASFNMAEGWKQWREEAKENLKKTLLEDAELGKKYVSERQDHILLYRDRVLAKTWYNVNEMRWEMDPMAASYAVSKHLIGKVCIRNDWRVMFVVLKGDNIEYLVDIEEYDAMTEKVGGFDGLFIKMVSSGIPLSIEKRPISIKELGFFRGVLFIARMSCFCLIEFCRRGSISILFEMYFGKLFSIYEEFMYWVGFKAVEKYVPRKIRMMMGMAWPEAADEVFVKSGYLEWQTKVENRLNERMIEEVDRLLADGIIPQQNIVKELLFVAIRFLIYASPFLILFFYIFGALCLRYNDVARTGSFILRHAREKYQRLKKAKKNYFKNVQSQEKDYRQPFAAAAMRDEGKVEFTVKDAFDEMKRIRSPPVRLKDFAGIDAIKEEVNEIISFLRNPRSFQKIGARPPRGILITGVSGSGKTTLAYAIAAEAKVPVVTITHDLLTVGNYVGEAAANVRELFQTARQLAPVIIFMDRFETIGIRGDQSESLLTGGVNKQEEIINQFLVELDGFETKEGVVVLATATNPEETDDAIRRPGRMDKTIVLPSPNEKEREQILRLAATRTMHSPFVDIVDWQKVAKKMAGMNPAELQLVPESLECAALSTKISDADELLSIYGWLATIGNAIPNWLKHSRLIKKFDESIIDHLGLRVTNEEMTVIVDLIEVADPPLELQNFPTPKWTNEMKLPHVVWAVGRGLLASLLPNFDTVDSIWLDETSWEGAAFVKLANQTNVELEDSHIETRSHLEKRLVLCFGSYVAGRLLNPEESNNLSTPQIEEAMKIATRMVLEYGWSPFDSPMVYFTDISPVTLTMGKEHESELNARIEKLFYSACDKATDIIQRNRQALDALVAYLLEHESMLYEDISRILEENGAQKEPEPFTLFPDKFNGVAGYMPLHRNDRSYPVRNLTP